LIRIDKDSRMPIYEQVIQNIISLVLSGTLQPGDRIVSVRKLARQLAVNPNTIQKSYAKLLEDGVLVSAKGRGNFVAEDIHDLQFMKKKEMMERLRTLTKDAKQAGIWIDELLTAVDAAYSEG